MKKTTNRFVFFKRLFVSFVLTYVYVSILLLSSENLYGARPWK